MAVTLEDIAKRAGVTQAAVSEIIRNHPNAKRFREETRQRVLKIADDLHYRPHFFASQIRPENRKLAMLCVDTLSDAFDAEVTQAFETVLSEHGYHMLLSTLASRSDDSYDNIIGPHGLMALAVVGNASRLHFPDERLVAMAGQGVKIVTIGRRVNTDVVTQVFYDTDQAVCTALDHLLSRGAANLWIYGKRLDLGGESVNPLGRVDIALKHLESRPGVKHRFVNLGKHPAFESEQLFAEAIAKHGAPDAVFCETDWLAWGAMKALAEAGITVGRDVAVTGFNDDLYSRYSSPGLTTIRVPAADLGKRAARELIEIYEGRTKPGARIELATRLVERESCQLDHSVAHLVSNK